jgi:hypothetical protein
MDGNSLMTKEDFAARMEFIINAYPWNRELQHIEMDALMCELLRSQGYEDGVNIFVNHPKWYA